MEFNILIMGGKLGVMVGYSEIDLLYFIDCDKCVIRCDYVKEV